MLTIVEKSGDRKLSATMNVSATWVAQQSCPKSCELRGNGCYAEINKSGLTTHRLNTQADETGLPEDLLLAELAECEALGIRALSGERQLRVHVVGDCSTPYAAEVVGSAMVDHEKKAGQAAWTYTHAWRDVPVSTWHGARVLASCHNSAEVNEARALGYGTALVTQKHPSNKVYTYQGETVIPCPAQFIRDGVRTVTCEDCRICKRPDWLRDHKMSVGFEPDGGTQSKVLAMLAVVK